MAVVKKSVERKESSESASSGNSAFSAAARSGANANSGNVPGTLGTTEIAPGATAQYIGKESSGIDFGEYYNKISAANAEGKKTSTLGGIQNAEESSTKQANIFDRAARAIQTIGESFSAAANEPFQKSLEENGAFHPQTLGAFALSLPTGMMAAPWEGVGQGYEAATGRDITNANATGEVGELTPEQRIGSAINFGVNTLGMAVGGSGEFARAAARGIGTAAKAARGGFNTKKFIGKQAEKLVSGEKKGGVVERGLKELKDSNIMKSKPARLAARYGMGTFEEGAEEWVQSYADDMRNETLDDTSLQRANEAFGWGALGGAMFEGAASAMNVGLDKVNKKLNPASKAPVVDTDNDSPTKPKTGFEESYVPAAEEYIRDNAAKGTNYGTYSTTALSDSSLGFDNTKIAFGDFAGMLYASSPEYQQSWAQSLGTDANTLMGLVANRDIAGINSLIQSQREGHVAIGINKNPRTIPEAELTFWLTEITDGDSGIYFNPLAASFTGIDVDGDIKGITCRPYESLLPAQPGQTSDEFKYKLPSDQIFNEENPNHTDVNWENLPTFGRALADRGTRVTKLIRDAIKDTINTYSGGAIGEANANRIATEIIDGLDENASLTATNDNTNHLGQAIFDMRNQIDANTSNAAYRGYAGNRAVSHLLGQLSNLAATLRNDTDAIVEIAQSMKGQCEQILHVETLSHDVNPATGRNIDDEEKEVDQSLIRGNVPEIVQNMSTIVGYLGLNTSLEKARSGDVTYRQDQQLYFRTKQRDAYLEMLNHVPSSDSLSETLAQMFNVKALGEKTVSTISGIIATRIEQKTTEYFIERNNGQNKIRPGDNSDGITAFKESFIQAYNEEVKSFNDAWEKVNKDTPVIGLSDMHSIGENDTKAFNEAFMKMYRDAPLSHIFSLDPDSSLNSFTLNSFIEYLNQSGGYSGELSVFSKKAIKFITSLVDSFASVDEKVLATLDKQIEEISKEAIVAPGLDNEEAIKQWLSSIHYKAALYKFDSIGELVGGEALTYSNGALLTDAFAAEGQWGIRALNGNKDELTHLVFSLSVRNKFKAFFDARADFQNQNPNMSLDEIYENYHDCLQANLKQGLDGSFFSDVIATAWSGDKEHNLAPHNTDFLDLCSSLDNNVSWADINNTWSESFEGNFQRSEPLLVQVLRNGDSVLGNSEITDKIVRSRSSLRTAQQNNFNACQDMAKDFFATVRASLTENEMLHGSAMQYLENMLANTMNNQNDILLASCLADQLGESSSNSQKGQVNPSENLHAQQMIYALQGGLTSWLEFEDMQNGSTYTERQFASNRNALMAVLFDGAEVQLFNGNSTWTVNAQTLLDEALGENNPNNITSVVEDGHLSLDQFEAIVMASPTMITTLAPPVYGDVNLSTPEGKLGYTQTLSEQFTSYMETVKDRVGMDGAKDAIARSRISWALLNYSGYYAILAGSIDPKIIETGSNEKIRDAIIEAHKGWIKHFADQNTYHKSRANGQGEALTEQDMLAEFRKVQDSVLKNVRPLLQSVSDVATFSRSASASAGMNSVVAGLGNAARASLENEFLDNARSAINDLLAGRNVQSGQQTIDNFVRFSIRNLLAPYTLSQDIQENEMALRQAAGFTTVISTAMRGEDAIVDGYMSSALFEGLDATNHDEFDRIRTRFQTDLHEAILDICGQGQNNFFGSNVQQDLIPGIRAQDLIWDNDINPLANSLNAIGRIAGNINAVTSYQEYLDTLRGHIQDANNSLVQLANKAAVIVQSPKVSVNGEAVEVYNAVQDLTDLIDVYETYLNNTKAFIDSGGVGPLPQLSRDFDPVRLQKAKINIDNAINVQVMHRLTGQSNIDLDIKYFDNAAAIGESVNNILFDPCHGLIQDDRIPAGTRITKESDIEPMPELYLGSKGSGYFAIHSQLAANVGRIQSSIGLNGMGPTHQLLGLSLMPHNTTCNAEPDPNLTCPISQANFTDFEGRMVEVGTNFGNGPYVYATPQYLARMQRRYANDPSVNIYAYPLEHCLNNGWCSKCNSFDRVANVITQILDFTQEDLVLRLKKSLSNIDWLYDEVTFNRNVSHIDYDANTILDKIQIFREQAAETLYADLANAGLDSLTQSDVYSYVQFLTPAFKTTLDGNDHVMLNYSDIVALATNNMPADMNESLSKAQAANKISIEFEVMPLEQVAQKIEYDVCNNDDVRDMVLRNATGMLSSADVENLASRAYSDWSNYEIDTDPRHRKTLGVLQRGGSLGATQTNALSWISNPTMGQAFDGVGANANTYLRNASRVSLPTYNENETPMDLKATDPYVIDGHHPYQDVKNMEIKNQSFVISDIIGDSNFKFFSGAIEFEQDERNLHNAMGTTDAGKRSHRRELASADGKNEMYVFATNNEKMVENALKESSDYCYGHNFIAMLPEVARRIPDLSIANVGRSSVVNIGNREFNVYQVSRIWERKFEAWQPHINDRVYRSNKTFHGVVDKSGIAAMPDAGMEYTAGWAETLSDVNSTPQFVFDPMKAASEAKTGPFKATGFSRVNFDGLSDHFAMHQSIFDGTATNDEINDYFTNNIIWPDNVTIGQTHGNDLSEDSARARWTDFINSANPQGNNSYNIANNGISTGGQNGLDNLHVFGALMIRGRDNQTPRIMPLFYRSNSLTPTDGHMFEPTSYRENNDGTISINHTARFDIHKNPENVWVKLLDEGGKGTATQVREEIADSLPRLPIKLGNKEFNRLLFSNLATVKNRTNGSVTPMAVSSMDGLAHLLPSSLRYQKRGDTWQLNPHINPDLLQQTDQNGHTLLDDLFQKTYTSEAWEQIATGEKKFFAPNTEAGETWGDADQAYFDDVNEAIQLIAYRGYNTGVNLGELFEPHDGFQVGSKIDPRPRSCASAELMSLIGATPLSQVANLYHEMNHRIIGRIEGMNGWQTELDDQIDNPKDAPLLRIVADRGQPYLQILVVDPALGGMYVQGHYGYDHLDEHQSFLGTGANNYRTNTQSLFFQSLENSFRNTEGSNGLLDLMFVNRGQSLGGINVSRESGNWYLSNEQYLKMGNETFENNPAAVQGLKRVGIYDFAYNNYYKNKVARQAKAFESDQLLSYNNQSDEPVDISKIDGYDERKQRLAGALGMTNNRLTDTAFQNIFKLAYGYTNDDLENTEFVVPAQDFRDCMDKVINNAENTDKGVYLIAGGYANGISGKGSSQERFSFPLGERGFWNSIYENSSTLKSYWNNNGNGGFEGFIAEGRRQMAQSVELIGNIHKQTGSPGAKEVNKKNAYNNMIDYLGSTYGMEAMSGHVWADFYLSDIEQNDALMKNLLMSDEQREELALVQEQSNYSYRQYQMMQQRLASSTTQHITNDIANQGTTRENTVTQVSRDLVPHRSRLARNMTTLLKINQMAEPMIAVANAAEGFVRTGLMRAQLNLPGGRRGDRESVCSDNITAAAANNLELRQLFEPLSKAHFFGKTDELLAGFSSHYAAGDLDAFVDSLFGDQTRFQKFGDRFFRKMSCDKLYTQTKLDLTLKYFALLCEQNNIMEQCMRPPDGGGQTFMEIKLQNDPLGWLQNVLSNESMSRPYFLQAMNMAEKVTMSQENVISCLADYAFDHTRFGGAAKFLTSGVFTPFYRYKLNQIGKLASCVLPISTMHYLAVDLLSQTELGEKVGIDRVQMHARLFDAMLSDAMHFTIPVCAAILASLTGALGAALQPPEDKDKEWDYREWTLFGERIGEVWWIQDIMGMAMPMACWFASCQNGNPNMAILVKGFETQVSINPMLNPFVTFDMLMNDDIESDYGLEGQVDATGAEPDAWDLIRTDFMTSGLSFLSRYITPSLVREISQSYNYEKSYKRVFTNDALAEGSINPENGQSGATRKVDYTEAQIRKITRNNYILATIMDLFNPNATTSYGATGTIFNSQGMPNVEYYNQEYLYYQNKYSIYDEGGNLKSQAQCDQVALDIITTLEQYGKDDMEELYNQGFAIDYDTRSYVSTVLSQMIKDSNTEFYDWYNSNEAYWKVLGDGDYETGQAIRSECYDEHQALVEHWQEIYYDKLWSDELTQGIPTYFSENTTYRQSSSGDIYASGDLRGLATSFNLPFYGLETENTLGAEGDWQTPDPRNGESLGRRALVAKENDYVKTPSIDSWTEDTEEEASNNNNNNNNNNGSGGGWTNYRSGGGYSRRSSGYSRSGGGYSRSGGGYSSSSTRMPNIYSNVNRLSPDRATTMNTSRIYDPNYAYIRPNFETKGSREASKRSDF